MDILPNKEDMPEGWPGVGLEHGLREEHLVPRCTLCFFFFGYEPH
jgi:hypothetical protein